MRHVHQLGLAMRWRQIAPTLYICACVREFIRDTSEDGERVETLVSRPDMPIGGEPLLMVKEALERLNLSVLRAGQAAGAFGRPQ